jgi:hypothetical protein
MLENPTDPSSTANVHTVKRYAPPNQRNRSSISRRKSGGDKLAAQVNVNDAVSRNVPILDHHISDANDNLRPPLISLQGCSNSAAFRLLTDRWVSTMNTYNNPSIDLSERPVMYSGSGASAWGQFRLPHQLMGNAGPSSSQKDFLAELRQAMRNANVSSDTFNSQK